MSGETEQQVSAWTVDSLREHMDEVISQADRRYEQRFEAQERAIATAIVAHEAAVVLAAANCTDKLDKVEAQFTALLDGFRIFYDTVLGERDQRYEQRFTASEKAVVVALATVDKEFAERVRQVRDETLLAMAAAEKAIVKAENATEKRFESVNEFRAQQADIIQTFARKSEIDTRMIGLTEKVESYNQQTNQLATNTLPRAEYDRAHTDLAERVIQVEKGLAEKLEAQAKGFEARFALIQSQLNTVEAITR